MIKSEVISLVFQGRISIPESVVFVDKVTGDPNDLIKADLDDRTTWGSAGIKHYAVGEYKNNKYTGRYKVYDILVDSPEHGYSEDVKYTPVLVEWKGIYASDDGSNGGKTETVGYTTAFDITGNKISSLNVKGHMVGLYAEVYEGNLETTIMSSFKFSVRFSNFISALTLAESTTALADTDKPFTTVAVEPTMDEGSIQVPHSAVIITKGIGGDDANNFLRIADKNGNVLTKVSDNQYKKLHNPANGEDYAVTVLKLKQEPVTEIVVETCLNTVKEVVSTVVVFGGTTQVDQLIYGK